MHRAIFVDRDGTLIEDQRYNFQPDSLQLLPGVPSGLRVLREAGYKLVVITNQSGVARGLFDEDRVQEVHARLARILAEEGVFIDAFYYCPHYEKGLVPEYSIDCDCRKPKPGMILRAARELLVDLAESWVIGDIYDDVEAGQRAGCKTVLIDGDSTEAPKGNRAAPTYIARDFLQAVTLILNHRQSEADGQGYRCNTRV